MHQRATLASHRSFARSGWRRSWLYSLLVLWMSMLLAAEVLAHPESASPTTYAAERLAKSSPPPSIPHCEHGHGWEQDTEILLRAERLDVGSTTSHQHDLTVAPPTVATTIGLPHEALTLARLPLFLLTQRLRP